MGNGFWGHIGAYIMILELLLLYCIPTHSYMHIYQKDTGLVC